jgi:SAM-dependent methyltransferase
MDCIFNEDYYEHGVEKNLSGYSNYRWLPELTIPLCFTMIELLGIHRSDRVLDFGCSKGYIVKGFRLLYREAYGVDISPYAISQAPTEVRPYLSLIEPNDKIPLVNKCLYDWTVAKDVLEHIPYEMLDSVLDLIREASRRVFVIVPLGDGTKFNIPAYENDITHIIRESLDWWTKKFESNGFTIHTATTKMKHIKSNWDNWENGNGFFVLESLF